MILSLRSCCRRTHTHTQTSHVLSCNGFFLLIMFFLFYLTYKTPIISHGESFIRAEMGNAQSSCNRKLSGSAKEQTVRKREYFKILLKCSAVFLPMLSVVRSVAASELCGAVETSARRYVRRTPSVQEVKLGSM